MRNSDTYKGFVYQKKCAFLLLLNELADRTGVIAFRMEHPKGDDFDLIYKDELRIFQMKDVATAHMPEYLIKMWRRYKENICPGEKRAITLGFIFSRNHAENVCFSKLSSHEMCSDLINIKDRTDRDGRTLIEVSSVAEWERFLRPITVDIRPDSQVETELNRAISYMFIYYGLPESDLKAIYYEFLGRLDEIMAAGKEVPEKEVREVLGEWFSRYSCYHPIIRNKIAAEFQNASSLLSSYQPPRPSISGQEILQ